MSERTRMCFSACVEKGRGRERACAVFLLCYVLRTCVWLYKKGDWHAGILSLRIGKRQFRKHARIHNSHMHVHLIVYVH